ncbi:low-density lipoprotein receptor class A domain-containing protein 1 isoform X1 [Vombatus ursinus]|uniref:low-density lipoprotein receptor class A domain-containing protein 1 isoform X1 n=1 Tax=Vombatus ursinus TaxID=29139 RepID=UPI000FFD1007|nr:low-density lipoprotein receptor class A domain-containing protein 1 isoform X1 [Vombatus ursinus]
MNRIFPQPRTLDGNPARESKTLESEEDCCGPFSCCTRRGFWISAWTLLLLTLLTFIIWLVSSFGLPPPSQMTRACATTSNQTGFLCDDRDTCIPASLVCDHVRSCTHGEDEEEALCGNVPHSLPSFLVFHCSDPTSWVFEDRKCDGFNDCGDCSDEGTCESSPAPPGLGWREPPRCPESAQNLPPEKAQAPFPGGVPSSPQSATSRATPVPSFTV